MKDTKHCPHCGGEILAVAKKCKHCGEWLKVDESNQPVNTNNPQTVNTHSPQSTQESNSDGGTNWLLILSGIVVIAFVVLVWFRYKEATRDYDHDYQIETTPTEEAQPFDSYEPEQLDYSDGII